MVLLLQLEEHYESLNSSIKLLVIKNKFSHYFKVKLSENKLSRLKITVRRMH